MTTFLNIIFLLVLAPTLAWASLQVGLGKTDITPPLGTPSAGYTDRNGTGMTGVHDPLLALALVIETDDKKIALCSVDHLGFSYDMVQEITKKVQSMQDLATCEIYIASSHTHSGGGAYMNIPQLGQSLAGTFSPEITQFYIDKTCDAIIEANKALQPALIGIGYGKADTLSSYRGMWPKDVTPVQDVTVIKVTRPDHTPLAALFNYPVHPTVLQSQNRLFSADFVGYARDHLQAILGPNFHAMYVNGAQGDIVPKIFNDDDRFDSCKTLGTHLADTVDEIWKKTAVSDTLNIRTHKHSYAFTPQATPFGLVLPIESYKSELNLIVLNDLHAILTMPGELSCVYDKQLKKVGEDQGFSHVSIFGLINDAHGYIILPEAWRQKTMESGFSFGGTGYGDEIEQKALDLFARQKNRK